MPAQIINGLITFLGQQALGASVWDGEVPRYNTDGTPINPGQAAPGWPAVKLYMKEGGFHRDTTTEDPNYDLGEVLVQVWATSRQQLEGTPANPLLGLFNRIEALFAQASLWPQIPLGGPLANPHYVVEMYLTDWYSGQEEGARTANSEFLYRGDLHYQVGIHYTLSTF